MLAMTMREYITNMYPIKDRIERIKANPLQQVMDADGLPYDSIRYIDGVLQKVVEIASDTFVSVAELLTYSKEDIDKLEDNDFKEAYYAYMENVTMDEVTLESLMSSVRNYRKNLEAKGEMIKNVQNSSR